jgi:hypothetical protein
MLNSPVASESSTLIFSHTTVIPAVAASVSLSKANSPAAAATTAATPSLAVPLPPACPSPSLSLPPFRICPFWPLLQRSLQPAGKASQGPGPPIAPTAVRLWPACISPILPLSLQPAGKASQGIGPSIAPTAAPLPPACIWPFLPLRL